MDKPEQKKKSLLDIVTGLILAILILAWPVYVFVDSFILNEPQIKPAFKFLMGGYKTTKEVQLKDETIENIQTENYEKMKESAPEILKEYVEKMAAEIVAFQKTYEANRDKLMEELGTIDFDQITNIRLNLKQKGYLEEAIELNANYLNELKKLFQEMKSEAPTLIDSAYPKEKGIEILNEYADDMINIIEKRFNDENAYLMAQLKYYEFTIEAVIKYRDEAEDFDQWFTSQLNEIIDNIDTTRDVYQETVESFNGQVEESEKRFKNSLIEAINQV